MLLSVRRFSEAKNLYLRAHKVLPEWHLPLHKLGKMLLRRCWIREAERAVLDSLKLEKEDESLFTTLGQIYKALELQPRMIRMLMREARCSGMTVAKREWIMSLSEKHQLRLGVIDVENDDDSEWKMPIAKANK